MQAQDILEVIERHLIEYKEQHSLVKSRIDRLDPLEYDSAKRRLLIENKVILRCKMEALTRIVEELPRQQSEAKAEEYECYNCHDQGCYQCLPADQLQY